MNKFKRLLNKVHDKILGEPLYYAIYDSDGKELIALSVNWFLVRFGSEREILFADRQDCEAIYAEGYFFDPGWMLCNIASSAYDLQIAKVRAISKRKFDKLWDEWFPGLEIE